MFVLMGFLLRGVELRPKRPDRFLQFGILALEVLLLSFD